jgi:TonB family protein
MKPGKTQKLRTLMCVLAMMPALAIIIAISASCKNRTSSGDQVQLLLDSTVLHGQQASPEAPPTPPTPPPHPYNVVNGDTVWFRVDVLPVFPGGVNAMMDHIGKTFTYPEKAKKKKIQGRVVVGFVLTKDCRVVDARIVTGIHPDCDNEALRVVNSLPQFEKPAFVNGRPVAYHFTLPVHYTLQ